MMELDIDTIIKLVQGLGFPVFVAVYLLVVNTKALKEHSEALAQNTNMLKELRTFFELTHPKP